jgi:hypothetical protein
MELRDARRLNKSLHGNAALIDQPLSIFYNRQESYYQVKHLPETSGIPEAQNFEIYHMDLYDAISYDYNYSTVTIEDIIIKYFNKEVYNGEDLLIFDQMVFEDTKRLFYLIPLMIFAVEQVIKDILTGKAKIPKLNSDMNVTNVTYGTQVLSTYSDILYTYFVGVLAGDDNNSSIWIVNRYTKENNMKVAVTYVEPVSLQDCQILSYV